MMASRTKGLVGLPIAIELLGGVFEESRLLKLAYAWEQTTHPRRPPFSTPALVDGVSPKAVGFDVVLPDRNAPSAAGARSARVHFTFDATTGELGFEARMEGPGADRLIALILQRSDGEKPGPIIFHLLKRGDSAGTGSLTVQSIDRENLVAGRLYLHCYTSDQPLGIGRVAIKVPGF